MLLLKSLTGIPGHGAARRGRLRGLSPHKRLPRPLLLERLETRLCLSMWSEPINLGSVINTSFNDRQPTLSPDGLSLYIASTRPGGTGTENIWVFQRASLNDSWGPAQSLGPTINIPGRQNYTPSISPDGHRLFYTSTRPNGDGDIWLSWRDDTHDDFGWQPAVKLGPEVNSLDSNYAPTCFEDGNTGATTLYFESDRPGGLGDFDLYASTLQGDGTFTAAVLVPELSSPYFDGSTAIRSDGLEAFIVSNRPGGLGSSNNLWVSTRASTLDPWSRPVSLSAPLNMAGSGSGGSTLSSDANTMFFTSNRRGGFGGNDIWISVRLPMVADHFTFSAPGNTTAGQTVPLTVTAWDHYGNIATGYTGTVTFASSDPLATLPASYTFTAADNGTHDFAAALRSAGAQSIKATDTVGEIIGAQAGLVVNPAAADHFLITAALTAVSGTPFDVTISALDPYSNIDTNYQGTVTFTTTDADSGVVLPANYTFTTGDGGDNGLHTFPGGVMLLTGGDQTFTGTDTVSGIIGSITVTVGPGP
jgi:hypothetical protein